MNRGILVLAAVVLLVVVPSVQASPPAVPSTVGVVVTAKEAWFQADGQEFYNANVTVFFRLSESDPDQTNGDYRYNLTLRETYFGPFDSIHVMCSGVSPPAACNDFTGSFGGVFEYFAVPGREGWAFVNLTLSGDPRADNTLTANVTADRMDLSIDARSGPSCTVTFDSSVILERRGCGPESIPWTLTFDGAPTFPLINVPESAEDLLLPTSAFSALLGFGLVGMTGLVGYRYGGTFVALGLSVLALGFAAVLGLFPMWSLVIVFLVGIAIVATRFSSSGGGA